MVVLLITALTAYTLEYICLLIYKISLLQLTLNANVSYYQENVNLSLTSKNSFVKKDRWSMEVVDFIKNMYTYIVQHKTSTHFPASVFFATFHYAKGILFFIETYVCLPECACASDRIYTHMTVDFCIIFHVQQYKILLLYTLSRYVQLICTISIIEKYTVLDIIIVSYFWFILP